MENSDFKKIITERSFKFGVRVLKLAQALPKNPVGYSISNQIIRSGTSIGANIQEAQAAHTRKDFANKLSISLKEARETAYWIDLIVESELVSRNRLKSLREDCEEIIKILVSVLKKVKNS